MMSSNGISVVNAKAIKLVLVQAEIFTVTGGQR